MRLGIYKTPLSEQQIELLHDVLSEIKGRMQDLTADIESSQENPTRKYIGQSIEGMTNLLHDAIDLREHPSRLLSFNKPLRDNYIRRIIQHAERSTDATTRALMLPLAQHMEAMKAVVGETDPDILNAEHDEATIKTLANSYITNALADAKAYLASRNQSRAG